MKLGMAKVLNLAMVITLRAVSIFPKRPRIICTTGRRFGHRVMTGPRVGRSTLPRWVTGPLTTSYHCSNGSGSDCGTATPGGSWGNAWHTYGVDRESGTDTVYWDGKEVATYTPSDGGADEYFLINVGNSTGSQCNCGGPSAYGTNSQVKIDYVRAWKKE